MLRGYVLRLKHTVNQKAKLGVLEVTAVYIATRAARAYLNTCITKIGNILTDSLSFHFNAVFFIKEVNYILLSQRMIVIAVL